MVPLVFVKSTKDIIIIYIEALIGMVIFHYKYNWVGRVEKREQLLLLLRGFKVMLDNYVNNFRNPLPGQENCKVVIVEEFSVYSTSLNINTKSQKIQ